jgi:hypothetical protein
VLEYLAPQALPVIEKRKPSVSVGGVLGRGHSRQAALVYTRCIYSVRHMWPLAFSYSQR